MTDTEMDVLDTLMAEKVMKWVRCYRTVWTYGEPIVGWCWYPEGTSPEEKIFAEEDFYKQKDVAVSVQEHWRPSRNVSQALQCADVIGKRTEGYALIYTPCHPEPYYAEFYGDALLGMWAATNSLAICLAIKAVLYKGGL